jgi:acylphosphatase
MMQNDLLNLVDRLSDASVEFVIIGGLAGIIHGLARTNQNIEVCCKFTPENLLKLFAAIKNANPVHRMSPNRPVLVLNSQNADKFKNLYLDTDIGQLNCLGEVQGIGNFDEVCKNAISVQVGGKNYQVLSLDALIKSKKSLNRPTDKQDVLQLQAIKQSQQEGK